MTLFLALWCASSLPVALLLAGCIRVAERRRPRLADQRSRPTLRLVPPLDEERAS